jgi:uncharacterized protein (DUF2062 family)
MWNWLKKKLPTADEIRRHRSLRIFGNIIHSPNYWHFNRGSLARAAAIGLFCSLMPVPFQMLLSAAISLIFRANIFIAVVLVWISNPITIPPIFYFCYRIGRWLLNTPPIPFNIELSWHWFESTFIEIWKPLLIGSTVCALVSAIIGYLFVFFAYNWLTKSKHR